MEVLDTYRELVFKFFDSKSVNSDSLEENSLHQHLLVECHAEPTLHTVAQQLWHATRSFYYLLPRRLIEFSLLPLVYQFSRSLFGNYLTTLQQSLPSVAPSHLLLLSLTYLHHSLAYCIPAPSPDAVKNNTKPILCGMKLMGLEITLNNIITGKCQITVGFISNQICEMLCAWLQLPRVPSSIIFPCIEYLFTASLPYASSSIISQLLLQISLSGCNYTIFRQCIQQLPSAYFSQNYHSILRFVNKSVSASVMVERIDSTP